MGSNFQHASPEGTRSENSLLQQDHFILMYMQEAIHSAVVRYDSGACDETLWNCSVCQTMSVHLHATTQEPRLTIFKKFMSAILTNLVNTLKFWLKFNKSNTLPYYTGCPRRNGQNFGRVFLMLNYTNITQNTYIQSWTVTEIMARQVSNFDSCYTLID